MQAERTGRQSRLVQSEPVLRRGARRRPALRETSLADARTAHSASSANRRVQLPGFPDIRIATAVFDFQFRNAAITECAGIVIIQSDDLGIIGNGSVVIAFS